MSKEILSNDYIDFWEYYYRNDKGMKLLFDIYRGIKQENISDISLCRDEGYNLCLTFKNDYLLTVSTILKRLKNIDHFYESQDGCAYFMNNCSYHIYKTDDNWALRYQHYNLDTQNDEYFMTHSERIRKNNWENIENIIKKQYE